MLSKAVPGVPGEDYPIYSEVPDTGFSCEGQVDGGESHGFLKANTHNICKFWWKIWDQNSCLLSNISFGLLKMYQSAKNEITTSEKEFWWAWLFSLFCKGQHLDILALDSWKRIIIIYFDGHSNHYNLNVISNFRKMSKIQKFLERKHCCLGCKMLTFTKNMH